jgi:hypothetical protein
MGNSYGIGKRTTKKPAVRRAKLLILLEWAWVELNYRPHAYQAWIVEAKVGQDVRISL